MEGSDALVEARVAAARGEIDQALGLLDARLERAPGDAPTLVLKGALLLQVRRDAAALVVLREAVERAPRSAAALNGLARVLHGMGRDDEAVEQAERAKGLLEEAENFRETAPVYLTLVWCLRGQRRLREALELAEEGLERCPDAVLAQWASVLEEELAEAEKDRC